MSVILVEGRIISWEVVDFVYWFILLVVNLEVVDLDDFRLCKDGKDIIVVIFIR